MRWTPLALGLALLAAGCIGMSGDETTEQPAAEEASATSTSQAETGAAGATETTSETAATVPTWQIGDWWTYELSTPHDTREVTFVVQDKTDGTYQLLVDDRQLALLDALYDIAYIGALQVETLAAGQGPDATRLFHWPLEDGKRWTTQWDGEQRGIMVDAAEVPLASGTGPGFELVAASDGEPAANYTYAPAVGWFTRLHLPEIGVTYELVDAGSGSTETVLDATAEQVHEDSDRPAGAETFTVPEGADELAVQRGGDGPVFAQAVVLVGPEGTPHPLVTEPCLDCSPYASTTVDAVPGEWTLTWAVTDRPATAGIHAWLDVWWLDVVEKTPGEASDT